MSIKLKKLVLSNFRSFYDKTVIEFPESGIIQLQADSGSGKSNLFLAISHALGFCPLPSTVLSSWGTNDTPYVQLELEVDDNNIVVTRSEHFNIEVNGDQLKGSKKEKQNQLEALLSITADNLQLLTFFPQDSNSSFLYKSDAEKKELLTVLLGLNKFEQAVEIAQKNIKVIEKDLLNNQSVYRATESIYLNNKQALESISLADLEHRQLLLMDIQTKLQFTQTEYNNFTDQIDRLKRDVLYSEIETKNKILGLIKPNSVDAQALKKNLDALIQIDKQSKLNIDNEVQVKQKYLDSLRNQQLMLPTLEEKYEKLLESKTFALKDTCPTCKQGWIKPIDSSIDDRLMMMADAIAQSKTKIKEIPEVEQVLKNLVFVPNPQIIVLTDEFSKLAQKALEYDLWRVTEEARFKFDHTMLVNSLGMDKVLESQRKSLDKLNQLKLHTSNLEIEIRYEEQQHKLHKQNLETLESQRLALLELSNKIKELEVKINLENDFIQLVGKEGFLGVIFEDVLNEISQEANEILHQIPNTKGISSIFSIEKENKDGTSKRSIVTNVFVAGETLPWQASLSGGQRSILCLAINMALGKVLSRRCKVAPSFVLFDEVTNGADLRSKEAVLEIMSRYAQESLIILVDHDIMLREMVHGVIKIENTNGRSSIVWDK